MMYAMCSLFLVCYFGLVSLIPINNQMADEQVKRRRIVKIVDYEDGDDDSESRWDIPPSGIPASNVLSQKGQSILLKKVKESRCDNYENAKLSSDHAGQIEYDESPLRIYEGAPIDGSKAPPLWITELEHVLHELEHFYLGPISLLPSDVHDYFTHPGGAGLFKTKVFYAALFFAVNCVPGKLALRFMIMRKNLIQEDMILHFKNIFKRVMDEDPGLNMYFTFECKRALPVNCITREVVENAFYPSGNISRLGKMNDVKDSGDNKYF